MVERLKNKRILFVDHDEGRSGSTISLEYLLRAFIAKKYDCYVLTSKDAMESQPFLEAGATLIDLRKWYSGTLMLGFHFTTTSSFFSWRGMRMMVSSIIRFFLGFIITRQVIKKIKPDLVYVNEYIMVQASVAAYFSGVPSVIHIRSPFLKGDFGVRRRIISRLILAYNRFIIAITRIEAEQLNPYKEELEKILIVGEFFSPCYVSNDEKSVYRELFGLPKNKKIILMLGGIELVKGTIDFLRAAQLVISERNDVIFVIAGKIKKVGNSEDQAYFMQCMQIADSLKENEGIRVLGEVADSLKLIAASDIVISPSIQTHFSRPVIEAWGLGIPVIAAKTEHMKDLITHGVDGFLVDVHDYHSLSRYILLLLDNEELSKRLRIEGAKKAITNFNAERNTCVIIDKCNSLFLS
ncbi:MAG: hypothetical protein C0417_02545 [Chlorobiaceae bacterium]|nr:hypothetical protein [Chlorobiaceae bacterium]